MSRFFLVNLMVLVACAPINGPLKGSEGFVILPANNNHFRIEYYSKSAKFAETYWKTTAAQLCGGSFQMLYSKLDVIQFDMYVPIAGNNVNIGRQEYIQYGEVICEGVATKIPLTQSPWQEFNRETNAVKPVSEEFLTELLKISPSHLSTLPAKNASAELTKIWGKPIQQEHLGEDLLSVWEKGGDSWFPNQIGLLERNHCLKLIIILPGISSVITGPLENYFLNSSNIESLIINGVLPAYFYRSKSGCN